MALRRRHADTDSASEQVAPYLNLIAYEYALRRNAGLEPKEAVRWSLRRVMPPPDGLHPVVALIAGYEADVDTWGAEAMQFLEGLIVTLEEAWHRKRNAPGWRPGTVGMGW